jgi:RNA-dependent RNA polymerase
MVGRTIQVHGFALTDSAESVKEFLERISGAGTIYALKLRHPRNISANSRAFAIVQFQSQESASLVEDVVQRNAPRIGRFYLKTRPADRDIVPRPRIPMFSLEDTVLHLGCLVKENILSALFTASNVSVQFGFDMKKIYFYLSYNFIKYKLELSYESIWEIQLHRPPAYRSRTKFLLIQVGFSYNFPSLGILADF